MAWLEEGSPWELGSGKALVQLFLAQPLLSLCFTHACSLSLFGHKGVRPHTPASFPVALREVPGLAKIQTKSEALPAAFQLFYVLPWRSVLVCASTSCVTLSLWAWTFSPFHDGFSRLGLPASYLAYIYNR